MKESILRDIGVRVDSGVRVDGIRKINEISLRSGLRDE